VPLDSIPRVVMICGGTNARPCTPHAALHGTRLKAPAQMADHVNVNGDGDAALSFHAATNYRALKLPSGEPDYVMGTPPTLEPPIWEDDWSIDPRPYKLYTTLRRLRWPPTSPTRGCPRSQPAVRAPTRTRLCPIVPCWPRWRACRTGC
jgi:hypothetical protein